MEVDIHLGLSKPSIDQDLRVLSCENDLAIRGQLVSDKASDPVHGGAQKLMETLQLEFVRQGDVPTLLDKNEITLAPDSKGLRQQVGGPRGQMACIPACKSQAGGFVSGQGRLRIRCIQPFHVGVERCWRNTLPNPSVGIPTVLTKDNYRRS